MVFKVPFDLDLLHFLLWVPSPAPYSANTHPNPSLPHESVDTPASAMVSATANPATAATRGYEKQCERARKLNPIPIMPKRVAAMTTPVSWVAPPETCCGLALKGCRASIFQA